MDWRSLVGYDHWKYPLVNKVMSFRVWIHCDPECELSRASKELLGFDGWSLTTCITFPKSGTRGEDGAEELESSLSDQLGSRTKVGRRGG